ncbi:MAG: hypothetical protein J6W37_05775 [Bacteroidales bacterium]|nr:hypothetical protein [Bacteroidales bacterium]
MKLTINESNEYKELCNKIQLMEYTPYDIRRAKELELKQKGRRLPKCLVKLPRKLKKHYTTTIFTVNENSKARKYIYAYMMQCMLKRYKGSTPEQLYSELGCITLKEVEAYREIKIKELNNKLKKDKII